MSVNPDHLREIPDGWNCESWCLYLQYLAERRPEMAGELWQAILRFRESSPRGENCASSEGPHIPG